MKRLELKRVRRCQRCGRGRAELETPDGEALSVPLDGVRARELAGEPGDLRPLTDVVLAQLVAAGTPVSEVVLDAAPEGLRGLLTLVDGAGGDVVACTAQEAISVAVRGRLKLYATPEALARGARPGPDEHEPGGTIH